MTVSFESIHLNAQFCGKFFHLLNDGDPFQHIHTDGKEVVVLYNKRQNYKENFPLYMTQCGGGGINKIIVYYSGCAAS